MLKWVVTSGHSSTSKVALTGVKTIKGTDTSTSSETQNESFASEETQADSVLDNSDSLIEWQVGSKESPVKTVHGNDGNNITLNVCHGMHADSGISTTSHLEEDSFGPRNIDETENDSARHSQSSQSSGDDEVVDSLVELEDISQISKNSGQPRILSRKASPASSSCTNSEYETTISDSENPSLNPLTSYTWSAIDFHDTDASSSSKKRQLRKLKSQSADNFDAYITESPSDSEVDTTSQASECQSLDYTGHYTDSELCDEQPVTGGYCSGSESLDEVFLAQKHVVRCRPRKPVCRRKKKKSFFLAKLVSFFSTVK